MFMALPTNRAIAQYKITKETLIASGVAVVTGTMWGAREAYHADPNVFEKKFGVSNESFLGSDAWKRNYYNNDPNNKHKPDVFNFTRDFWHFSGLTSRAGYVTQSYIVFKSDKKLKYRIYDMLISSAVSSLTAFTTYKILRHE